MLNQHFKNVELKFQKCWTNILKMLNQDFQNVESASPLSSSSSSFSGTGAGAQVQPCAVEGTARLQGGAPGPVVRAGAAGDEGAWGRQSTRQWRRMGGRGRLGERKLGFGCGYWLFARISNSERWMIKKIFRKMYRIHRSGAPRLVASEMTGEFSPWSISAWASSPAKRLGSRQDFKFPN